MGTDQRTNKSGSRKAAIEAAAERPPAPPINLDGIPAELRTTQQWIGWIWEQRRDKKTGAAKWTKPPINPRTGQKADVASGKRLAWCSIEEALGCVQDGKADGIGFVFDPRLGYCGIDLDDCRDPETGAIEDWALTIIRRINSYAEVSPTGTGIKIILRGKLACGGNRRGKIEFYDRGRYFTVTGQHLEGTPATVEDRQAELQAVHAEVFKPASPSANSKPHRNGAGLADWQILQKAMAAKNGSKFAQLWAGDTSGHGGDDSAADLALCGMLAFWCAGDPARIDGLFRQTGLYRPKWDERRGEQTYGERTIAKALEGRTEFYGSKKRTKKAGAPASEQTEAQPDAKGPLGYDLIFGHFHESYEPTFRRGNALYSAKLGREVKPGEACFAPGKELAEKLETASDAPVNESGAVKRNSIPKFFRDWAPSAWRDILTALPEEEQASEVSDLAQEEFRGRVRAGLLQLVPIAYKYEDKGETRTEVERRSLIAWCKRFAKPSTWGDVRGYRIWGRHDLDARLLRVALRVDLFAQIHFSDLSRLSQRKFGELCALYGVGKPCKVRGGEQRAVELAPEFLADIQAEPEIEATMNGDGRTDDDSLARACERDSASVRPSEGNSP